MQLEDALRLEIQCLMNEKAALRAELADVRNTLRQERLAHQERAEKAEAENAALKAHVERLRVALECIPVDLINAIEYGEKLRLFLSTDSCKLIGTALAATPEQSLAKLRAEMLRDAANLIRQTTPISAPLISASPDPYEIGKYGGRMYAIKQLEEEANNAK